MDEESWTWEENLGLEIERFADYLRNGAGPPSSDLSDKSGARAKALFYLLGSIGTFLIIRFLILMAPTDIAIYRNSFGVKYVDASTTTVFTSTSSVAATLWVIIVSILAILNESRKKELAGELPPWYRRFEQVEIKREMYWFVVSAVAITSSFQTALYLSIISSFAGLPRWFVTLSCYGAIALLASLIAYVQEFSQTVVMQTRDIDEIFPRRIIRAESYQQTLKKIIQQRRETADFDNIEFERLLRKEAKTKRLLQELHARMTFTTRKAKLYDKQLIQRENTISSGTLNGFLSFLIVVLILFSTYPEHDIAFIIVVFLLFVGIFISTRTLFVILFASK